MTTVATTGIIDPNTQEGADQLLDLTARHLEVRGWCRGDMTVHRGERTLNCLVGGLRYVHHGDGETDEGVADSVVMRILADTVQGVEGYGLPEDYVIYWNDQQRDKRKVTRLLRRAARKVRSGQYDNAFAR